MDHPFGRPSGTRRHAFFAPHARWRRREESYWTIESGADLERGREARGRSSASMGIFFLFFLEIRLKPTDVDVRAYTSNSASLHLRQVSAAPSPPDSPVGTSFHRTPVADVGERFGPGDSHLYSSLGLHVVSMLIFDLSYVAYTAVTHI